MPSCSAYVAIIVETTGVLTQWIHVGDLRAYICSVHFEEKCFDVDVDGMISAINNRQLYIYRHQHVTRVAELQPFHDDSQTLCRESTSLYRDVILRLRFWLGSC